MNQITYCVSALLRVYDGNSTVDTNMVLDLWRKEVEKCGRDPTELVDQQEAS